MWCGSVLYYTTATSAIMASQFTADITCQSVLLSSVHCRISVHTYSKPVTASGLLCAGTERERKNY